MSGYPSLPAAIDQQPLTRRYWSMASAVMVASMLDYFDFFIIGFVVAIIAVPWGLTYGQVAAVLLAAGIGSIVGAALWGWLGDKVGRRPALLASIIVFPLGTGALALTPEGSWEYMAAFRFIVGAGVAGLITVIVPLLLELTPTRLRSSLVGFLGVGFVPLGILVGSVLAATLAGQYGWRSLFVVGIAPILLAFWVARAVPESPRWLLGQGRPGDARKAVARLYELDEHELPLESAPAPEASHAQSRGYRSLLAYPRSIVLITLSWLGATTAGYGLLLWGPSILQLVTGVTAAEAAWLFVFVTLAAFIGRAGFSVLPRYIGRTGAGLLMGFAGAALLALAGIFHSVVISGISLFWVLLMFANLFTDGGLTNLAPLASEVFPARLRAHGAGYASVINGVGKILGPIGLALIAGSSNVITPHATTDAVIPGFLYLAAFELLIAVAFLVAPIETANRSLEAIEADLEDPASRTTPSR